MDALQQGIYKSVDALSPELTAMADAIFDNPEPGNEEFKAYALVTDFLKKHGFTVEDGVAGLKTAFRATWGKGGPRIGLLGEYDALQIGHACGHHMQCPAMLGAAIALKQNLGDTPATIVVMGTPAEETTSGKLPMAKAGLFDDLDLAFMMHSSDTTTVDTKSLALNLVDFIYTGRAAHAAANPEKGVNALDSVILLYSGIGLLREHMRDDARVHGIITDGGKEANVVPARAVARFYIRAGDRPYLNTLVERVFNVARGAALATGAELAIEEVKAYDNKVGVPSLDAMLVAEAKDAGAAHISPPRKSTGSSDFSCVTYRVPGACLRASFVEPGIPSHSQAYLDAGKSKDAHDSIIMSAKSVGVTSLRLARNPEQMRVVQEEFRKAKAAFDALA